MADDTFFTEVATGEVRDADVPRDGLGRYLLPSMTTGEVKGRTRVTTVAGTMESGYGLTIWRRRTVIRGMGLRPDLMSRAGAADPNDPGYDKLMDSIEAAAFEAGGGSTGQNLGSAQHHVFDRYFGKGESLDTIAEYFHADIKAVEAELARKKIKLVPGYNERVVYCRLYDRGGKIDAIAELEDGTWVIVDWKTEKDPVEHPSGKTIQQAYYSNADGIMNYDTHEYEPMPPVRRDFSLVIWCRPGSGEAKALRVPVDLGWVGARVAEDNRAWHQQKINIHEYFPGTGLAPAVVPLVQEIPGAQAQIIANAITPEGRAAPNAFMSGVADVRALAQEATSQPYIRDDTGSQGVLAPTQPGEWQPAGTKCSTCGYVHTAEQGCPSPEWAAAQAVLPQNGNAAQIKEVINQQIQSGQPIGPEQVAQMNTQAAAIVGQQLPPGVPAGTVAHGPASQPPRYPGYEQPAAEAPPVGVPPGPQPPAPKGAGKNTPPAEYIQDLIARTGAGIDPDTFYQEMVEELATLSKKEQLQPMLRLISPGIDEASLRKHREPLATMIVECVKAQHNMRNRGGQVQDTQTHDQQAVAAQSQQQNSVPAPWGQQPANNVMDLTYEGVMQAINEAPSLDRLGAIYQQWTHNYGPASWTGNIVDATIALGIRLIAGARTQEQLWAVYQQWTSIFGPDSWAGPVLDHANAKLATFQQLAPTH